MAVDPRLLERPPWSALTTMHAKFALGGEPLDLCFVLQLPRVVSAEEIIADFIAQFAKLIVEEGGGGFLDLVVSSGSLSSLPRAS